MHRPVLTSAPATALVSLTEIKNHVRLEDDVSEDDTLLAALVQAATDHLDGWSGVLGRCLITQTWRQDFECWTDVFRLPFPDVQSVTSITYRDEDDSEQTVSSSLYELLEDERGSFVRFRDAFTSPDLYSDKLYVISVTFVAGYGDNASDVPDAIRRAAQLLAGHWYEMREAVAEGNPQTIPMGVATMIDSYRRIRL